MINFLKLIILVLVGCSGFTYVGHDGPFKQNLSSNCERIDEITYKCYMPNAKRYCYYTHSRTSDCWDN